MKCKIENNQSPKTFPLFHDDDSNRRNRPRSILCKVAIVVKRCISGSVEPRFSVYSKSSASLGIEGPTHRAADFRTVA